MNLYHWELYPTFGKLCLENSTTDSETIYKSYEYPQNITLASNSSSSISPPPIRVTTTKNICHVLAIQTDHRAAALPFFLSTVKRNIKKPPRYLWSACKPQMPGSHGKLMEAGISDKTCDRAHLS